MAQTFYAWGISKHYLVELFPVSGSKEVSKAMSSNELLTVSEVARILRVDDTTVRRWVKQGALEAVVLPHVNARQAYRIKRETLNRVLGAGGPPQL